MNVLYDLGNSQSEGEPVRGYPQVDQKLNAWVTGLTVPLHTYLIKNRDMSIPNITSTYTNPQRMPIRLLTPRDFAYRTVSHGTPRNMQVVQQKNINSETYYLPQRQYHRN